MFATLASLASVLASLPPVACFAFAYAFALVLVCAIVGAPFMLSERDTASLMSETSDPENDFFGSEGFGAEALAMGRVETSERAPLMPQAPTVEIAAPSTYPAVLVKRQCWAIDAGPQWGTYYVRARNFRQAAEALRAAFVEMNDPDIGAPDPSDPNWLVRPVSFIPRSAALIDAN